MAFASFSHKIPFLPGGSMHFLPKIRLLLVGAALFLTAVRVEAAPITVVVPNADASVEGNSNNGFPFNLSTFGLSAQRYQQVYNASQFSAFTGPVFINQIAFRPDAQSGAAFSSTLSNVRIDLSTTSASAGTLSSTYANNVGANDTIVFSGSLSLS